MAQTKSRIAELAAKILRMTQAMSINWNTCDLRQNVLAISRPQSGRIWQILTGIAVET